MPKGPGKGMGTVSAAGAAAVGALVVFSGYVRGDVIQADPSNYRNLLSGLGPGDALELAPGQYTQGLPLTDLAGEPGNPIVITGPENGDAAVFVGDPVRNTVSIRNSAYVTIRYLTIDGQNIEDVDAVKAEGGVGSESHHIVIEHCTITGHDANQMTCGISTKAPVWDWVIRRNTIWSAGTGLYLGDSTGDQPFVRGLIEYNLVVDPVGYCMEIKHQNPRPNIVGMPPDGSVTIIRHNVFIKNDVPSPSGDRPNVLVGRFPTSGPGVNDRYEIYGNFIFHNPREHLFQGEGNVHFHDNVLVDGALNAVSFQNTNGPPQEVYVYNNTVCGASTGIWLRGTDSNFTQRVWGNAVFADAAFFLDGQVIETDNITDTLANAAQYVVNPSFVLGQMDFYPLPGQLEGSVMDMSLATGDTDHDLDFNGTAKDFTFRGAYQGGESWNPGWPLDRGLKNEPSAVGPDGGIPPDGGGPGWDGSVTGDGGPGTDGGAGGADGSGGCSCRGAPRSGRKAFVLALLGFLLALCARRRRRSV